MTDPATALLRSYANLYTTRAATISDAVGRAWWQVANVDDVAAARWIDTAARLAAAYRPATANLTSAYLARQVALLTGTDPTAPGLVPVDELATLALRGVGEDELWGRPVIRARTVLGRGSRWVEAMGRGEAAAREIAVTDLALAQRRAVTATLPGAHGITGYRRALTGAGCPLCAAAAPRTYHTDQLMPIHTHCRCVVTAVGVNADPGALHNATVIDLTGVTPSAAVTVAHDTEIAPSLQEVPA